MRTRIVGALALSALVGLAACSAGGDSAGPAATKLTVFAASSLTTAFTELGHRYEQSHPGTIVSFNFLSSSDLAAQIEQGAPADVFASADEDNMQRIEDAGLTDGAPQVFAHNELEILVPPGNPQHIETLADLADPSLVVSLCNSECPAGKYAAQALHEAGVTVKPDSEEIDVKSVSTRIETGEADAGIGYSSDVVAAGGKLAGVQIPQRDNVTATYPLAVLKDAPPAAAGFSSLVLSRGGQRVLERFGFLPK